MQRVLRECSGSLRHITTRQPLLYRLLKKVNIAVALAEKRTVVMKDLELTVDMVVRGLLAEATSASRLLTKANIHAELASRRTVVMQNLRCYFLFFANYR